jgi:hypothetical protein
MKSVISRLLATTIIVSLALSTAFAADNEKKKDGKAKGTPYNGTIGSVDKSAKTVTIKTKEKSRSYQITAETRISKAGKPATLDDAVVGEVAAAYGTEKDGKYMAISLRLGEKVDAEPKGKGKGKGTEK